MATPIIDSAVAAPSTVSPGGSFVVTIIAHDPDARALTLSAVVTDAEGNSSAPVSIPLVISDPITYALSAPTGAGFTITARAGSPNVFDCKAP